MGSSPIRPNAGEETLANSNPTDPAWASVTGAQVDDVFMEAVLKCSPTAGEQHSALCSAFWLTPAGPRATRRYVGSGIRTRRHRRKADHEASTRVGDQDLDICEAVQRGYNAGIDTRGRLSPVHERGVAHVHRLLAQALDHN